MKGHAEAESSNGTGWSKRGRIIKDLLPARRRERQVFVVFLAWLSCHGETRARAVGELVALLWVGLLAYVLPTYLSSYSVQPLIERLPMAMCSLCGSVHGTVRQGTKEAERGW